MTNYEQSAARVLTRCGPFSERQAERFVETLSEAELAELVALHEQHAADPTVHQGGRFNDLLHNVAEREKREAAAAKEEAAKEPPAKEPAASAQPPASSS